MKKVTKLSLVLAASLAFGCAAVACDDDPGKTEKPQEPPKYTVTYAIGEGATGTAPTSVKKAKDDKFDLPTYDADTATFSKEGWTFDGWHDGTTKYAGGAEYTMPDSHVTFTAQWKLEGEDGTTYTITYDLNGGIGTAPTEAAKATNATFTVATGNGIVREDYDFAGWNDGKTTYEGGETYTVGTSNITFTAQWDPKPGISLPVNEGILEYSGDCTLPVKAGYGGDKGGENIVGIAVDTTVGSEYLYYKLKGASGWVKSKSKYFAANTQYMPDKYGASAHYYEGKIGELNYYALFNADYTELTLCNTDDEILENGVFTKVGHQTPATVTVTFDLDYSGFGATNPPEQKLAYNATATEPEIADRSGYIFNGWHVGSKDGALFNFATPVTQDIKLVAGWTSTGEQYTISFTAAPGVTGSAPESYTKTQGEKLNLPENTYTKTGSGWTFAGWKSGIFFLKPGAEYTVGSTSVTFTAVFQKTYTDSYYNDEMVLRDDGFVIVTEDRVAYTTKENGDIVIHYEDGDALYRLDDTDDTITQSDGTESITKTAENGAILSFDGFGGVTLDTHTGTYELIGGYYPVSMTLTFGDVVVEDIPVSYGFGAIQDVTLNATITIDSTEYVFENVIEIPEAFIGTFEGKYDGDNTLYSVVITADSITVTIGNDDPVVAEITAYNDYDGFTLLLGEDEYYLKNSGYGETVDGVYFAYSENYNGGLVLDRKTETPEEPEIPSEFIGVYEGTKNNVDYVVQITKEAITVKIGDAAPITAVITEYDEWQGFTIKLGSAVWYIASAGESIYLMTSDYSSMITCSPKVEEPEVPEIIEIPEKFVGNYEGTYDGTTYVVAITADKITVKIGDAAPITAEITEYDDSQGFTVKIGGDEWYIYQYGVSDTIETIALAAADDSVYATCARKAETPPSETDILSYYIGENEAAGVKYGFADAASAGDQLITVSDTLKVYKFKVYFGYKTAGVDYVGIMHYKETGTGITALSSSTNTLDTKITDATKAGCTVYTKISGNLLTFTFSVNSDNKRQMTITYSGKTYTFVEITAAA